MAPVISMNPVIVLTVMKKLITAVSIEIMSNLFVLRIQQKNATLINSHTVFQGVSMDTRWILTVNAYQQFHLVYLKTVLSEAYRGLRDLLHSAMREKYELVEDARIQEAEPIDSLHFLL